MLGCYLTTTSIFGRGSCIVRGWMLRVLLLNLLLDLHSEVLSVVYCGFIWCDNLGQCSALDARTVQRILLLHCSDFATVVGLHLFWASHLKCFNGLPHAGCVLVLLNWLILWTGSHLVVCRVHLSLKVLRMWWRNGLPIRNYALIQTNCPFLAFDLLRIHIQTGLICICWLSKTLSTCLLLQISNTIAICTWILISIRLCTLSRWKPSFSILRYLLFGSWPGLRLGRSYIDSERFSSIICKRLRINVLIWYCSYTTLRLICSQLLLFWERTSLRIITSRNM